MSIIDTYRKTLASVKNDPDKKFGCDELAMVRQSLVLASTQFRLHTLDEFEQNNGMVNYSDQYMRASKNLALESVMNAYSAVRGFNNIADAYGNERLATGLNFDRDPEDVREIISSFMESDINSGLSPEDMSFARNMLSYTNLVGMNMLEDVPDYEKVKDVQVTDKQVSESSKTGTSSLRSRLNAQLQKNGGTVMTDTGHSDTNHNYDI